MSSNWGRWGQHDERGALNLIDRDATFRGLASVDRGEVITLGLTVEHGAGPVAGFRSPTQHFMRRDGGDYAAGLEEHPGYGFADDTILLACHGTTHIDALAHVWRDGLMWNGYEASNVTSRGAAKCGVDKLGPIVTRGLFVDVDNESKDSVEGESIGADELLAAVEAAGVVPAPGDALLVRTGWLAQWRAGTASTDRWAGLDHDCAELIAGWDLAVLGADNLAVEVGPSTVPGSAMPLHLALLRDRGIPFLELLDLEELADAGVAEFMLVIAPLNIAGGSGSPVAPVAVI